SVLLISPERTLPGPISINLVAPSLPRVSTDSYHLTGLVTCRTSMSIVFPESLFTAASQFITIGADIGEKFISESVSASLSAAGFMSGQWNGALTSSGTTLLAPLAFAASDAAATASLLPDITVWPGAFRLA